MSRLAATSVIAGKVVLVGATLVAASSMGGLMLSVFALLVPLHWWAATDAGPRGTAGWALLAGISMLEAGWMGAYTLGAPEPLAVAVGAAASLGTMAAFVLRGARDAGRRAARSRF